MKAELVQGVCQGLRSTVARNSFSLYLIQVTDYIVPLIVGPYLVRVLGPAGYGAVAFAQGFINYLMLFVEYGFDWSATRKISVMREDLAAVNRVALHVWAAKGLLSLVGLVVLGALTFVVPKLREVAVLLFALYGLVLGNALFPTWLFQGMERMVAISLINLGMKPGALAGVFLLVKKPEDALLYAGLAGGGSLLAGLTGAVVAFQMFGLKLTPVSARGVWEALREGWTLFLSKASVGLYTAGNAFILGILTNHTVVGYYSVAERIVLSISGLMGPIAQAVYPRISKLASESRSTTLRFGQSILIIMGSIGFALTSILIVTAPMVTHILLGTNFERSIVVIRILAVWIFINAITNIWGIQIMLPLGYDKAFLAILLLAGLTNVTLAIPLSHYWQEVGMALSVLVSIVLVAIAQPVFLWKKAGITPWLVEVDRKRRNYQ